MNGNSCDDATDRPVSLKNEATPDVAVFSGAAFGGGGGLYCNRKTTMRISNNRRILTDRETITRIFMT